jgi:hypothetical protein
MPKSCRYLVLAVATLMMLVGAVSELRGVIPSHTDFEVYYTAASLVRANLNLHLYDDADRGVDPQLRFADEHTVFAEAARAHGIDRVNLYVYPPTLADLVVPLTFFSISKATIIWNLLNLGALLCISFMLTQMLGMQILSAGNLAIVAFVLIFRPILNCFYWEQVTILLLFLLMTGLSFYSRGNKNAAGFMFALASAIKITPLIVILPFVIWQDWKSLRAITLWGTAILGMLWFTNGGETLSLYFRHVLPAMSNGIVILANKNLATSLQVFWRGCEHGNSPIGLLWAGKFLSGLILCYAVWLSRLRKKCDSTDNNRFMVVALFLLLSCCLAPVAWRHAYVLAIPALAVFAKRAWEGYSTPVEAILLLWFILSISSSRLDWLAITTGRSFFYYLAMMQPLLGVALGILGLRKLEGVAHEHSFTSQ